MGDAMRPPPPTIPATMSLGEALDHALRGTTDQPFPVVDESGRVIGSVSMRSARRLGGRDPLRPVREALIPLNQTTVLERDETLDGAFEWLGNTRAASWSTRGSRWERWGRTTSRSGTAG